MNLEAVEARLAELRENANPADPFDWDDVEYLRLLGVKLRLGVALNFNPVWFEQMAEKLSKTLLHDRCGKCNRVLHSIAEGRRGICSSCWFASMPADTKRALGRTIASAFNGATEQERNAVVDESMRLLKRDEGEEVG